MAGQQLARLRARKQVEVDRVGTLGRDHASELAAAGYDDGTGWRARQEGAYLISIARVVQDDQHALVRHQAAVETNLGVKASGDTVGRDGQRRKEGAQCLGWGT